MSAVKSSQPRKRTRLSPDARRAQLLDSAREIIADQGVSSLTMELVAKEAGVSNPLIYKYFNTRLTMLQELLVREFDEFERELSARLDAAADYSEVVEIFVRTDFEQAERSNILRILSHQPDIRVAILDSEKVRLKKFVKLLIAGLADNYPVSPTKAARILAMSSGASKAAAEHHRRFGGRKNQMIMETKALILSGINTAAKLEQ